MADAYPLNEILRDSNAKYCNAAKKLLADEALQARAQKCLAAWGIETYASYVGAGHNAVVLEASRDPRFVVRLAFENSARAPIPQVLQAIHSQRVGPLLIEVLPRVRVLPSLGDTEAFLEYARQLAEGCKANGYRMSEPKRENIGLLPDGTPIIIDAGAVENTPVTRLWQRIRGSKADNSAWLSEDGITTKQQALLPQKLFEGLQSHVATPPAPPPEDEAPQRWRNAEGIKNRMPRQID